jgi:hypothetical protein
MRYDLFRSVIASLLLTAIILSTGDQSVPKSRSHHNPEQSQSGSSGSSERLPSGVSQSDWGGILQAHEEWKHSIRADGDGWRTHNPETGLTARFDRRGIEVQPEGPQCAYWTWGLELVSHGIGTAQLSTVGVVPEVHTAARRIGYVWDENLEEWYQNDGHGLEHGYTIRKRPVSTNETDSLVLRLRIRGGLRVVGEVAGRSLAFGNENGDALLRYSDLKVLDAAGRDLPASFESDGENGIWIRVDDASASYPVMIDPIISQQAYLKASNTKTRYDNWVSDKFGSSVAISGDTAVIGAPYESSSATGVNGDQLNNITPVSGAAYVFIRSGGTWKQQAYLKASNTGRWDSFGYSVAIYGETVVVGAIGEARQSEHSAATEGAAYVFVRSGTTWSQQAYLKASNAEAGDQFGWSVAISGETVVVGATGEASNVTGGQSDNSAYAAGAAYVFVRSGTTWSQQAYLKASNAEGNDNFGWSVAISGETVVVGAVGEDSSATGINGNQSDNNALWSGATYVFSRTAETWSQQAYLKASNTDNGDNFGYSVAISGETVVVGAVGEASSATGINGNQSDNNADASGAAYVFTRTGVIWSMQAYLKTSNRNVKFFGWSVAISGETVVVGAVGEDSSASGVNGDQTNNNAPGSGAAYVFNRSTGTWSQQAYLKASNTGSEDDFGWSVAISVETVIVGAIGEGSNATGVNGDQSNNSIPMSGAGYLFTVNAGTWSQQAYLKASNTEPDDFSRMYAFGSSVAASGDTVVVGAPGESSDATGVNADQWNSNASESGAAYVFIRAGGTWSQQAYLKASNTGRWDSFGYSVAISGDTVVIGASGEDSSATGVNGNQLIDRTMRDSGAAYIFIRNGETWSQQAYLKASNTDSRDSFGSSVVISGDTVVIGAPGEDSSATGVNGNQSNNDAPSSGTGYIFTRTGGTWSQQAYIKASNTGSGDSFGSSVVISGDTVVIGAPGEDSSATGVNGNQSNNDAPASGAGYIFTRTGGTWSQQAYIKASNTGSEDSFGSSVVISGDTVVIGAPGEDSSATGINGNQSNNDAPASGAVYIFTRSRGTWNQQGYLKASNSESQDRFGWSVAISSDTVVVGASGEDSSSTGINGEQTNNNAVGSGAAYVFTRSGVTWSQQAYLKASNTGSGDEFGRSVTISGDTVVTGASTEASNARGVNADQSNNDALYSGAVYVFTSQPPITIGIVEPPVTAAPIGPGSITTITQTLTNNTTFPITGTFVATLPGGLNAIGCTSPFGSCSVATISSGNDPSGVNRKSSISNTQANQTVTWTGTIPANGSVTITYQVQVGVQVTSGSQYCITSMIGATPGPTTCIRVNTPASGPGNMPVAAGLPNQQKPGSLLIFNLYTSSVNTSLSDTQISLTNTNPVSPANVHLFFVDGSSCSVADQIVTLTQNQTVTFRASDVDPGVTGYLIAVAVDQSGCPVVGNYLIGGAVMKFESGHHASLPAIGVSSLSLGTPPCLPNSVTATLAFNGIQYDELPRGLGVASLPSLATGNSPMLIINRIGGDMTSGAERLGPLAGLLFDDGETSRSFTLTGGTCQLRGMLGNNLPRTVPRYATVIPAGRTGWMKFWAAGDEALSGVMINAGTSGFSGGYNLQTLTTTNSASLIIPVIPVR